MEWDENVALLVIGFWMAAVMVAMFAILPQYAGLGHTGRIMILHVPTAWVSVVAFALSAIFSGRYLWLHREKDDHRALAAAELGFLFTVLATITGMIFSQAVWGIFWNWDPRQTSIFILLLIYAALFALRNAISDTAQQRRLSAVYSLLAFVTVPFLIFVIPRTSSATLHPNCAFLPGSECDGIELTVGKIGLLGDRKVQLLDLSVDDTMATAHVKISEPGLTSESTLSPTFDLAAGESLDAPTIPGVTFRLIVEEVDPEAQQARINIEAPGTGLLDNQRTLITFLASIGGFTALFLWIFAVRVSFFQLQTALIRREEVLL